MLYLKPQQTNISILDETVLSYTVRYEEPETRTRCSDIYQVKVSDSGLVYLYTAVEKTIYDCVKRRITITPIKHTDSLYNWLKDRVFSYVPRNSIPSYSYCVYTTPDGKEVRIDWHPKIGKPFLPDNTLPDFHTFCTLTCHNINGSKKRGKTLAEYCAESWWGDGMFDNISHGLFIDNAFLDRPDMDCVKDYLAYFELA